MAHGHYKIDANGSRLRLRAGSVLKNLREQSKKTQREVAEHCGLPNYTYISQIEAGKGRLPPERLAKWAEALGANRRELALVLLRFYDPHTYVSIFGKPFESVDYDKLLTKEE